MLSSRRTVAAVLLQLASLALAHGGDEHNGMDMGDMMKPEPHESQPGDPADPYNMPSYAGLGMHSGMILAHIILMVLAWFFILPIGTSVRHCAEGKTTDRNSRRRLQHHSIQTHSSCPVPLPRGQWPGSFVWDNI